MQSWYGSLMTKSLAGAYDNYWVKIFPVNFGFRIKIIFF